MKKLLKYRKEILFEILEMENLPDYSEILDLKEFT